MIEKPRGKLPEGVSGPIPKIGYFGWTTGARLRQASVPAANMIGEEGRVSTSPPRTGDGTRAHGGLRTWLAQAGLDDAVAYAVGNAGSSARRSPPSRRSASR